MQNDKPRPYHVAQDFLSFNTEEYYRGSMDQYTVHVYNNDYEDVLNDFGKEKYRAVLDQIKKGQWTGVIKNSRLERSRSGSWLNPQQHPRYKPGEVTMMMCGWDNRVVTGELNGKDVSTSYVRFYKTDQWVSTLNGSLYKLE
jgi:hypothetical protein